MNETKRLITAFGAGFLLAALGAGIIAYNAAGKSAGEVAYLDRRYDELDRAYTERQRELEEQQRGIRNGVDECLGYVENAGAIISRTSENTTRAIGNLREASALIKAGIAERESLKSELDSLRSRLLGLRDMGGRGDTQGVQ